MFRKVFAQTLVALAFAAAADAGRAEWRALLVGVADYPTLPAGVERTTGARNDVLLLREVLRQRGLEPEQIRVLSDGVAGAELPTRANILRALDDLAAASAPGDSVFVHFSGHGSLEPGAAARGEGTPTFLPLNIGRWNGAAGVVENAIRQGDLRQRVDRIANRGAFVWGVFDACHSAVLVRRPGSPQLQRRFVDPAALGVPLGAIDGWRQGIEDGAGAAAISSTCARSINNETTGILPSALLNGCGRLAQPASQPVASTASSTRAERSDDPRDGYAVIEREGGQRSCKAASCDDCSNGRARIAAP